MTSAELAALRQWLLERLEAGASSINTISVSDVVRHAVGFSWETYTFTVEWRRDQHTARQGLALRREPEKGLLPPYDARRDHRLHQAVLRTSTVPMPALHWLETDPAVLGRPFYVMDQVQGIVPVPWAPNDPQVFPDEATRQRLGENFVDVLVDIHMIDLHHTGESGGPSIETVLGDTGEDTDTLALAEVHRWAAAVDDAGLVREPVLDAAVLWLERNVATSGRRALVHGDYRIGNFMVGQDGRINAVFDWELAHIGDPVFDLSWAALKLYGGRSGLMSRLLPTPTALQRYTDRTGLAVDEEVFGFWTVFSHLRALAPYLRAAQAFQTGETHDVRLANMGHQSGHLLKFLAEEMGLRPAPRPASSRRTTDIEQAETPMMQNSPDRLLQGAAQALHEVLRRAEAQDPFVRSQLQAVAELMANLAPRIEWSAGDLVELITAIRSALTQAMKAAPAGTLPSTADALADPVEETSVTALQHQRDAHLDALREVQRWLAQTGAAAHPEVDAAVRQLLAWQLETELTLLKAGTHA